MRLPLLIATLFFCGYSFAESQPPVPSKRIDGQQQQQHSGQSNEKAKADERVTDELPFVVKANPSKNTEHITSQNSANSQDSASDSRIFEMFSAVITAIATVVMAIFTGFLWYSTKKLWETTNKSVDLARDEFTATHCPKIFIRACKLSVIGITGDHKCSCKFTYFNAGASPAHIMEIGTRLINSNDCWTYGDREIQFEVSQSNEILESGQRRDHFTSKSFDSDLINYNRFFVGYIKYADRQEGGIIREVGFCRRWEPKSMTWNKEDNDEYEYNY